MSPSSSPSPLASLSSSASSFASSIAFFVLRTTITAVDTISPTSRLLQASTPNDDDHNTTTIYDADEDEDWNPNNLPDGIFLKQSLTLYGTLFLLALILFCLVRNKYPRAYNIRHNNTNNNNDGMISSSEQQLETTTAARDSVDTATATAATTATANTNTNTNNQENINTNNNNTDTNIGRINWLWKVYCITDIDIFHDCGMDALCLLRVIRWGLHLFGVGSIIGCVLLMPLYATANPLNTTNPGIERINASNIPEGSDGHGRLIATVIAAYMIFGYTMYTYLLEFDWFLMYRYKFLAQPLPRNYSIYVRNLPSSSSSSNDDEQQYYRTKHQLQQYFRNFESTKNRQNNDTETQELVSHSSFTSSNTTTISTKAWISLKIPNLSKLVSQRVKVVSKLEHAINVEEVLGVVQQQQQPATIDVLFQELQQLNQQITVSIERINRRSNLDNPYDYDPRDYQNPISVGMDGGGDDCGDDGWCCSSSSEYIIGAGEEDRGVGSTTSIAETFFDSISVDSRTITMVDQNTSKKKKRRTRNKKVGVAAVEATNQQHQKSLMSVAAASAGFIHVPETIGEVEEEETTTTATTTTDITMINLPNVEEKTNNNNGDTNHTDDRGRLLSFGQTSVNVVGDLAGTVGHRVENVVTHIVAGETIPDGEPMTAGFVTFCSLQACQAAKQMIHNTNESVFGMEVFEAPDVNDIFWNNVGKSHYELQLGLLISVVLTTLLCLFWTVVISFIATLSSVEGLTGVIPKLGDLLEKAPWIEMFLAQLAPLLINIANALLKVLLRMFSGLEGPISGSEISALTFSKLSAFMIIQTFFVSAISGSLVSQITAMIENPTKIVSLLANSLPNRSTYFIQILIADTCISLSLELLRVSAVGTAALRKFVGPNLTEKERRTTWMGIRPFADPLEFEHDQILSVMVLYFIVFFVYATLAPIASIFVFLCFLFMGSVYRNQFIFIYPSKPDSGGKLWVQFMRLVPICLLIAEITILGFLALKSASLALSLMFPLLIITVLWTIYIHQKHFMVTNFLPGMKCVDADRTINNSRSSSQRDMSFLWGHLYLQPDLCEKVLYPTNVSPQRQLQFGMTSRPLRRGSPAAAISEIDSSIENSMTNV